MEGAREGEGAAALDAAVDFAGFSVQHAGEGGFFAARGGAGGGDEEILDAAGGGAGGGVEGEGEEGDAPGVGTIQDGAKGGGGAEAPRRAVRRVW